MTYGEEVLLNLILAVSVVIVVSFLFGHIKH